MSGGHWVEQSPVQALLPLFCVSLVKRYRVRPCWSTRKGSLRVGLVTALIVTDVPVVVLPLVDPSGVAVISPASTVDVPEMSSTTAGATAVWVVPVIGTETVDSLITPGAG